MVETTLYELLGVPPDATTPEIKLAYRRAARHCHPDANPDDRHGAPRRQPGVDGLDWLGVRDDPGPTVRVGAPIVDRHHVGMGGERLGGAGRPAEPLTVAGVGHRRVDGDRDRVSQPVAVGVVERGREPLPRGREVATVGNRWRMRPSHSESRIYSA